LPRARRRQLSQAHARSVGRRHPDARLEARDHDEMGAAGADVLMRKALPVLMVLPLAACGGGSKSGGQPSTMTPVAYVKSSAAKTAQAPSEHVTLKGSLTVGTTLVTIDGNGDYDNAKKLGSMHADFSAGGLSG